MKKRFLSCLLCAALLFSGCQSRETLPPAPEENPASFNGAALQVEADEPAPEIEVPEKDENPAPTPQPELPAQEEVPVETEPLDRPNVVSDPEWEEKQQDELFQPALPQASEPISPEEAALREEKARALEQYLRDTLSPEDYGGIYLRIWGLDDGSGGVFLDVWTVNDAALDAALAAYPGEPYPINRRDAACSLAQMQQLITAMEKIELREGAFIESRIDEAYNYVGITVSEKDYDAISSEIMQLAEELQIPEICARICRPGPSNPVT